jgi:hypothetical protein
MNLYDQMKSFGPLLNLWEGGMMGEKIITTLKPEIISGLRKNWQINLFKKSMRKYFFDVMQLKGRKAPISPISASVKNTKIRYSTILQIEHNMSHSLPIVAEHLTSGEIIIRLDDNIFYSIISDGNPIFTMNCYFHCIRCEILEKNDANNTTECLLLPMMESQPNQYYFIITANWMEYDGNFQPKLARVSCAKYNDDLI